MDNSLKAFLAEALQEVLESMCFTMVDGPAESPAEEPLPCASVALAFSGYCKGEFWLSVPAAIAQEISSSFTGDLDLSRTQVAEVISKLGNIASGSTLSRYDNATIFDLDPPCFSWISAIDSVPALWTAANRVNLQIGAEIVSAGISMERCQ